MKKKKERKKKKLKKKSKKPKSMPSVVSRRDHLRFTSGIICGSGSFAVQFGDHLRSGIICGAVHEIALQLMSKNLAKFGIVHVTGLQTECPSAVVSPCSQLLLSGAQEKK